MLSDVCGKRDTCTVQPLLAVFERFSVCVLVECVLVYWQFCLKCLHTCSFVYEYSVQGCNYVLTGFSSPRRKLESHITFMFVNVTLLSSCRTEFCCNFLGSNHMHHALHDALFCGTEKGKLNLKNYKVCQVQSQFIFIVIFLVCLLRIKMRHRHIPCM